MIVAMNDYDARMVLRDVPVLNFALGLVFAAVGGYGLYSGGPAILLLFLAVGLGFLLLTSVLVITADRITRTLTLEYRSALHRSGKEFPFDEVAGISVQSSRGSKGGTVYRVVLKRKDGELVPFRSSSSTGSKAKERLAARVRDFIGVPGFDCSPAGMTYAALAPYTGFQETDGVHWTIQPTGAARWHSPDFRTEGFFLCLAQKAGNQASTGFLASVGGMIFRKLLSSRFQPEETPGLDRAEAIGPLDPALEAHFMAFSNAPDHARRLLNSGTAALLADWARRYPVRQLQKPSAFGPLAVLFGPGGVYLTPTEPLQPHQVSELTALGTQLVRSQQSSGHASQC